MGLFNKRETEASLGKTKRIVVAGGCDGCGVSFIAEFIAFGLARRASVSLTELGSPHFYQALGFESRFLARGYNDYLKKIINNDSFEYSRDNLYENINWICRSSTSQSPMNSAGLFRAYYTPNDNYCIFDCSRVGSDDKMALLASSDCPVIVIDPLPSKLAVAREFLEQVRFKYPSATLIVNKCNSGVHMAELNRFLGTKDYFSVNSVQADYIYKAEYNSESVFKIKGALSLLDKTQEMVCRVFQ